jgi:hypothetical protein
LSHFKERKEKNCLNCGAEVLGRYCQVCGQENTEPKESIWQLVTHFFYDITHFDGKFFSTVKYLLLRPGFLTTEYVRGRRMTYLHPIRMYVFTSAFFFLIFFSFINTEEAANSGDSSGARQELAHKLAVKKDLESVLLKTKNSIDRTAINKSIIKLNSAISLLQDSVQKMELKERETTVKTKQYLDSLPANIPGIGKENKHIIDSAIQNRKTKFGTGKDGGFQANFTGSDWFTTPDAYRAVQEELPDSLRDDALKRAVILRLIHLREKSGEGGQKLIDTLGEKFLHSIPQMLFVSLPLFALLLKFLYVRRKEFYYADHSIFTIHFYCSAFLLILLYYCVKAINKHLDWWIISFISAIIILYIFYYLYKAMRNFYRQGRGKTILKYLLLCSMLFVVMLLLMSIFLIISAYRV